MDSTANILQFCRLCLVKDGVNIPIFDEQGDIRQIYLKISSCLPVKVAREDHLPKKICDGCSNKLDICYDFWRTSAESEKQLLAWLGATGKDAAQVNVKEEDNFDEPLASDISKNDDDENKCYMFEQKVEEGPPVEINDEPPPSKRPRRTAAVKAAIAMDQNSDDDGDSGEPITKMEDDSDETDGDDREPAFVDVPSTSADDQPGPSGVSKDGSDAPSKKRRIKREPKEKKEKKEKKPKEEKLKKPKKERRDSNDEDAPKRKRGRPRGEPKEKPMKRKKQSLLDAELQKFVNINQVSDPLICQHCDSSFMSHEEFGIHSKKHSADEMFHCHLCEFKHDATDKFRAHVRTHDLYKCEKCSRILKTKLSAYKHAKTHSVQELVQCEICGKNLKKQCLYMHKRVLHTKERLLTAKCPICEKEYVNASSLRQHYSAVHREMGVDISVVCDICGMRLSCKGKLAQHMRTHTGDKPFACTFCPKKFIAKDILAAHMRVHTGEKPYECRFCGKRFAHSAPYRYHVKTHTGEKTFACPLCGKGFISRANMKIHLRTCNNVVVIK